MAFNIVAELQVRVAGVQQAVDTINRGLRTVNSAINVRVDPAAIQGIDALNTRLQTLRANLTGIAPAVAVFQASIGGLAATSTAAAAGVRAFNTAATSTAGRMATVSTSVRQASDALGQFGTLTGLATRRFIAFTAGTSAIVGLISGLRQAVSAAASFEREMVRIAQVSGDDFGGRLRIIQDEITRLSTGFGVSSTEMVKAATIFKQAGFSIEETAASLHTLADAALAPNFDSMAQTAEGMIAVMRQFKTNADETRDAIGAMNAVASAFAVEGRDLIEVVRRTGGAFSATGGDVKELIAIFTSVRGTTRESAAEISTGLRTIFTRLQRGDTIDALKELQINLRYTEKEADALGKSDLTGQFVGAYEAVRRLSTGLAGLRTTDSRYSNIVEQLGGFRQVSRVIPLIQQQAEAQKALNIAQAGGNSLTTSTEKAQEALIIKVSKLKEEYLALFRSLTESSGFRSFAEGAIAFASAIGKVIEYVRPLIPLLVTMGTISLFKNIGSGGGFFGSAASSLTGQNVQVVRRNSGGPVPGSGDTDSVHALLTPDEFVLNKRSSKKLGYGNLDYMNRTGRVPPHLRLNAGGIVKTRPGVVGVVASSGNAPTSFVEPIAEDQLEQFNALAENVRKPVVSKRALGQARLAGAARQILPSVRVGQQRVHDEVAESIGADPVNIRDAQDIALLRRKDQDREQKFGSIGFNEIQLGIVPVSGGTSKSNKKYLDAIVAKVVDEAIEQVRSTGGERAGKQGRYQTIAAPLARGVATIAAQMFPGEALRMSPQEIASRIGAASGPELAPLFFGEGKRDPRDRYKTLDERLEERLLPSDAVAKLINARPFLHGILYETAIAATRKNYPVSGKQLPTEAFDFDEVRAKQFPGAFQEAFPNPEKLRFVDAKLTGNAKALRGERGLARKVINHVTSYPNDMFRIFDLPVKLGDRDARNSRRGTQTRGLKEYNVEPFDNLEVGDPKNPGRSYLAGVADYEVFGGRKLLDPATGRELTGKQLTGHILHTLRNAGEGAQTEYEAFLKNPFVLSRVTPGKLKGLLGVAQGGSPIGLPDVPGVRAGNSLGLLGRLSQNLSSVEGKTSKDFSGNYQGVLEAGFGGSADTAESSRDLAAQLKGIRRATRETDALRFFANTSGGGQTGIDNVGLGIARMRANFAQAIAKLPQDDKVGGLSNYGNRLFDDATARFAGGASPQALGALYNSYRRMLLLARRAGEDLGQPQEVQQFATGGQVNKILGGIGDADAGTIANVGLAGFTQQLRALTRGEVASVRDYAEGSGLINSRLRGTDLPAGLSEEDVAEHMADVRRRYGGTKQLDQVIKSLDSAVGSGTIGRGVTSFRGLVNAQPVVSQLGVPLDSNEAIGKEFGDAGFLSTSVERDRTAAWSKQGLLQLLLKQGSPGIYLGNSSGGVGDVSRNHVEKELLLGRGSRFRIVGRDSGLLTAQQLVTGGLVKYGKKDRATFDELHTHIDERFAKDPDYAHGYEHTAELAQLSLTPGVLSRIPRGSKFLGSGIAGLAFLTPQNDVIRVQAERAAQKAIEYSRVQAQRGLMAGVIDESAVSTDRPNISSVLQANAAEVVGRGKDRVHLERLPLAQGIEHLPSKVQEAIINGVRKKVKKDGYEFTDDHAGNVGLVGGQAFVIDPSAVRKLPAAVSTLPVPQTRNTGGLIKGKTKEEQALDDLLGAFDPNDFGPTPFVSPGSKLVNGLYPDAVYSGARLPGANAPFQLLRTIARLGDIHTGQLGDPATGNRESTANIGLEGIAQQQRPITEAEKKALNIYSGEAYKHINALLRGAVPNFPLKMLQKKGFGAAELPSLLGLLDSAVGSTKLVGEPTLFRGVHSDGVRAIEKQLGSSLGSQESVGKVFGDRGYVSTSPDIGATRIFGQNTLQIIGKEGASAAYLDRVSNAPGEDEVLLGQGQKFKILGREGGRTVVKQLNSGGFISGEGNTDKVPALLTPGEYVLNQHATKQIGMARLHKWNVQGFASGGPVQRLAGGGDVEPAQQGQAAGNLNEAATNTKEASKTLSAAAQKLLEASRRRQEALAAQSPVTAQVGPGAANVEGAQRKVEVEGAQRKVEVEGAQRKVEVEATPAIENAQNVAQNKAEEEAIRKRLTNADGRLADEPAEPAKKGRPPRKVATPAGSAQEGLLVKNEQAINKIVATAQANNKDVDVEGLQSEALLKAAEDFKPGTKDKRGNEVQFPQFFRKRLKLDINTARAKQKEELQGNVVLTGEDAEKALAGAGSEESQEAVRLAQAGRDAEAQESAARSQEALASTRRNRVRGQVSRSFAYGETSAVTPPTASEQEDHLRNAAANAAARQTRLGRRALTGLDPAGERKPLPQPLIASTEEDHLRNAAANARERLGKTELHVAEPEPAPFLSGYALPVDPRRTELHVGTEEKEPVQPYGPAPSNGSRSRGQRRNVSQTLRGRVLKDNVSVDLDNGPVNPRRTPTRVIDIPFTQAEAEAERLAFAQQGGQALDPAKKTVSRTTYPGRVITDAEAESEEFRLGTVSKETPDGRRPNRGPTTETTQEAQTKRERRDRSRARLARAEQERSRANTAAVEVNEFDKDVGKDADGNDVFVPSRAEVAKQVLLRDEKNRRRAANRSVGGPEAKDDFARQLELARAGNYDPNKVGDTLTPVQRARLEKEAVNARNRPQAEPLPASKIPNRRQDTRATSGGQVFGPGTDTSGVPVLGHQEPLADLAPDESPAGLARAHRRGSRPKVYSGNKRAGKPGEKGLLYDVDPNSTREELNEFELAEAARRNPAAQPPQATPPAQVSEATRQAQARAFGRTNGRTTGNVLDNINEQAQATEARRLKQYGPAVSQETRNDVRNQAQREAAAKVLQQLTEAELRLLKAIYPDINAVEAHRLASEAAGKALTGQAKVVRDAQGNIIGTQATVQQAVAQGVSGVDKNGTNPQNPPTGGVGAVVPGRGPSFLARLRDNALTRFIGDPLDPEGKDASGARGAARRGLAGLGSNLNSTASLLTLPYIAAALSSQGGSAEDAAKTGNTAGFTAAQTASGAISGAVIGANIGAVLGPVGAGVGALTGALYGAVSSYTEAGKEIRQAKIGAALTVLADRFQALANITLTGEGSTVGGDVLRSTREQLSTYASETSEKNRIESSGYLTRFNAKTFSVLQDKNLRQDLGGQLPAISQSLQRQGEQIAKAKPDATFDQIVATLKKGNDGLNDELFNMVARLRGLPLAAVEDEFRKNLAAFRRQISVDKAETVGRQGAERNVNAFGNLLLSLQGASDSLRLLRTQSQLLSETFDGVVNSSRVSANSENLTQLGRGDRAALEPLELLRRYGGDTGGRLADAGAATDRVANVLPTILANVATQLNNSPTADQDFANSVVKQLREQLGKDGQTENVIANVLRGLNQAAGDKGVAGITNEVQVDVTKFSERLLAAFSEPLKDTGVKAAKLIEENANGFVDGLTRARAQYASIGESQTAQVGFATQRARAEADVFAQNSGRRSQALDLLPLSVLQAPLQAQQQRLTGLNGAAASDPAAIAQRLAQVRAALPGAERAQQREFQGGQGRSKEFQDAAGRLVNLKDAAANLQQALKNLTDVASRNAAIQEKLGKIQEDRSSRQSLGESYIGSDFEGRSKIARGFVLANAANEQGNLNNLLPQDQRAVIDALKSAGSAKLEGFKGSPRANDVLEKLIKNTFGGTFDVAGDTKNEERSLQKQLLENFAKAEQAQAELVKSQTASFNDFITNLRTQQTDFFTRLDTLFQRDKLNSLTAQLGTAATGVRANQGLVQNRALLGRIGITDDGQIAPAQGALDSIRNLANARGEISGLRQRSRTAQDKLGEQKDLVKTAGDANFQFANGTLGPQLATYLQNQGFEPQQIKEVVDHTTSRLRKNHSFDDTKEQQQAYFLKFAREGISNVTAGSVAKVEEDKIGKARQGIRNANLDPLLIEKELGDRNQGLGNITNALNAFNGTTVTLKGLDDQVKGTQKTFADLTAQVAALQQQLGIFPVPPGGPPNPPGPRPAGFAVGGEVGTHPGAPRGRDTIPAWLSAGEYVIRPEAVSRVGVGALDALNKGSGSVYLADGGLPDDQLNKVNDAIRRFQALNPPAQAQANAAEDAVVAAEQERQAKLNPLGASGLIVNRAALAKKLVEPDFIGPGFKFNFKPKEQREAEANAKADQLLFKARRLGEVGSLRQRQFAVQAGRFAPSSQAGVFEQAAQRRQAAQDQLGNQDIFQNRERVNRNQGRVPILGFASGGLVPHFSGGGAVDSVPAYLSAGEYVMSRKAVGALGVGNLDRANHYADGGKVSAVDDMVVQFKDVQAQAQAQNAQAGVGISPEVVQAFQKAAQQLAGFAVSFNDAVSKLNRGLADFGGSASKLADALSSFPKTLTVTGKQEVEVVVNGAEVLTKLMPELSKIVAAGVKDKLNEVMRKHFPEAGVNVE